ncbi:N-succinylarginine dihydrolase [Shigella flexneri]
MRQRLPFSRFAGRKVHLTVANLNNKFHRSLEAPIYRSVATGDFRDDEEFCCPRCFTQVAFSVMKGRQTITASVEITAIPVCYYLFTVVKKAMHPSRSAIRQGNPVRPVRRSHD